MGRHQSLDKHCKKSVAWLKTVGGVDKVVIGFSECCRHHYAPGVLRYKSDVEAGIKLNAYSGNGITDLFVKIEPIEQRDEVKLAIEKKFEKQLKS